MRIRTIVSVSLTLSAIAAVAAIASNANADGTVWTMPYTADLGYTTCMFNLWNSDNKAICVGSGGITSYGSPGVDGSSSYDAGINGSSAYGVGVSGQSTFNNGVQGVANAAGVSGVYGEHSAKYAGYGIAGRAYGSGTGVYGQCASCTTGYAAQFYGNVQVIGTLSKSAGSFAIDHPLDPANKILRHSFVESPDMKNIYDGVVAFGAKGEAWVTLPNYFDALNKDFRYQLTNIGGFAPVYIAQEISKNRFKIAGGKAGMKVSWQVTGTRKDAYAQDHRIVVEEYKPLSDRGRSYYAQASGTP